MLYKLKDIITEDKKCLFCNKKLNIILSNFVGIKHNGDAVISAKINKKNIFKFDLNDHASKYKVSLNCNTDILSFKGNNHKKNDYKFIKNFFEKLLPHLELYCSNKKCTSRFEYYLSSYKFNFKDTESSNSFKIDDVRMYMESFTVNDFWVQNNIMKNKLYIFIKNNPDADPIEFDRIDFDNLDKTKIIKKIMTIVSFS